MFVVALFGFVVWLLAAQGFGREYRFFAFRGPVVVFVVALFGFAVWLLVAQDFGREYRFFAFRGPFGGTS